MDILLDTHSVLWFLIGSDKMPDATKEIFFDARNRIYVSIATLWEVSIKISIGKLSFDGGIDGFIDAIEDNGFLLLDISAVHTKTAADLPFIHRDPFDRMLVAQAIAEGMYLMTTDSNNLKYDITPIW